MLLDRERGSSTYVSAEMLDLSRNHSGLSHLSHCLHGDEVNASDLMT